MSVAEGSTRSGKTIDNCIIAEAYLETSPDKIHLATGSSIGNAKLNIGACNGFGLENLFRGRCKWGKYKGNECLYIYTKTGEKVVIFAGGGKSDSYKKILGNSYGLWIATEINEHFDSDDSRESFIKVAFGRQVASKRPFVLWDLNPCNPKHKIYTDYIDKYKEDFVGGYNYEHFTLHDNLSITPERLAEIECQYDKNSIWYRRDILGQRCVAEGVIYRQYADNPSDYTIDYVPNDIMTTRIGVDFGGNGSATTFVCSGFTKRFESVIILASEKHDEELNPEQLNEAYENFVENCYNMYRKPIEVRCDSAEQILIRGIKLTSARMGLPISVKNALKVSIGDRIKLVNKLVAQGRFKVHKNAKTVENAMCEALWDLKHPDERLDNGSTDIDTLDALEYSLEPDIKNLTEIIYERK
jgi:PBSX family phage terminase large subunit